jgi:hypothetical protein
VDLGVTLLRRAQEAGLHVEPVGDKLVVRGPKRAAPLVKLLAEHKAKVLSALTAEASGVNRWQDKFIIRAFEWCVGGRDWEMAKRLAWGDMENDWHYAHGRRWPSWQCAGCDGPIGGLAALDLTDGNRVHLQDIECLIAFGRRWFGNLGVVWRDTIMGRAYLPGRSAPVRTCRSSR